MFELENVKYKSILSIDELEIEEGKVTAVIGTSGGGKSTLLKLLNKTISPTEGEIYYNEKPLWNVSSVRHRRNVLYLNQTPYLFKGTIKDNLIKGFLYQNRPVPEDETLQSMLKRVHLDLALDNNATNLSGGEAQRLALARILLLDGNVYLFDEPSSALDEKSEMDVLNSVIDWLRSMNKTVVMVTHSKDVALRHADHIYTVSNGSIREVNDDE